GAHAHGAADVLDRHVHHDGLVRGDGEEVDVQRLAPALVHLDLADEDAEDLAGDVEVDEAGAADGAERLVAGANVDADGYVDLAVVDDRRQAAVPPQVAKGALTALLGCKLHLSSEARRARSRAPTKHSAYSQRGPRVHLGRAASPGAAVDLELAHARVGGQVEGGLHQPGDRDPPRGVGVRHGR